MTTVSVTTANLFIDSRNPFADATAVRKISDVFGAQEVATAAHRSAMKADGWSTFWPGTVTANALDPKRRIKYGDAANAIPISWRADLFKAAGSGYYFAHPGEKNVTPIRGVSHVVLLDKAGEYWPVINWHPAQQGFPGGSVVLPHNRALWELAYAALQAVVAPLLKSYGRVVILGDANRRDWTPTGLTVAAANSIDYVLTAGDFAVSASRRTALISDHDALTVPLTVAAKPLPPKEPAMLLTEMADVLRAAGLKVVESPGWKDRGHGNLASAESIVCHHTAGPATGNMPSLRTVTNGRTGLAGPLCNLALGRDGTWYAVAAGLAYHAGVVRQPWMNNAHSIGIEAEATGTSTWPEVQMASYAAGCKALAEHYEIPVSRVLGHKEVCSPVGRKIDPNFDMAAFRKRITTNPPPAQEEDDMFTDDDRKALALVNARLPLMLKVLLASDQATKDAVLAELAELEKADQ